MELQDPEKIDSGKTRYNCDYSRSYTAGAAVVAAAFCLMSSSLIHVEYQVPVVSNHGNITATISSLVIERDVAQWLECGALSMSLPAVRFRIPLGAGF